ncbi:hypothetical protein JB92DRAFT_3004157 [Gautieria morchelliformis]|nr:hypothetical protein JB92DRAFT_3004157 [Gautieria morchelliformis]
MGQSAMPSHYSEPTSLISPSRPLLHAPKKIGASVCLVPFSLMAHALPLDALKTARAILDFIYLARYPSHSTTTLQRLQDALGRLRDSAFPIPPYQKSCGTLEPQTSSPSYQHSSSVLHFQNIAHRSLSG